LSTISCGGWKRRKRSDSVRRRRIDRAVCAFAGRWLVPRLARWRKIRPDAPLEVIGTDSVVDLNAGDADLAIRYARISPADGTVSELLKDTFWPICSPKLLGSRLRKPTDLRKHVLVHCYWSPSDFEAPTWQRWLAVARSRWPDVPELKEMDHLSFREEAHAPELQARTLVKAFDMSLPGYQFYLIHLPKHPREKIIEAFGIAYPHLRAWQPVAALQAFQP
jgi:LysR family transcriptional regulator, glycine cleavage system transcriptional activator